RRSRSSRPILQLERVRRVLHRRRASGSVRIASAWSKQRPRLLELVAQARFETLPFGLCRPAGVVGRAPAGRRGLLRWRGWRAGASGREDRGENEVPRDQGTAHSSSITNLIL